MLWPERFSTRSQDLPQVYHDAGQFYWGGLKRSPNSPARSSRFGTRGTVALDRTEAVDIDTEEDWKLAEQLFKIRDYLK